MAGEKIVMWKAAMAALLAVLVPAVGEAQESNDAQVRQAFERMKGLTGAAPAGAATLVDYVVIASDGKGHAVLRDDKLPFFTVNGPADGKVRGAAAPVYKVQYLSILAMPRGSEVTWHPAPQLTLNLVLAGMVEVETRTGTRRFGPGAIILGDDAGTEGHQTRSVGKTDLLMAVAPITNK